MAKKADKPTTSKRATAPRAATAPRPKAEPRKVDEREIAERAYFIYLEEGSCDEVDNWLRAERELTAA